jgi:hypothetical protein
VARVEGAGGTVDGFGDDLGFGGEHGEGGDKVLG